MVLAARFGHRETADAISTTGHIVTGNSKTSKLIIKSSQNVVSNVVFTILVQAATHSFLRRRLGVALVTWSSDIGTNAPSDAS